MKRTMLLLMALLAFAHAALAEDFSAYAVKTNGFAVFAPNPILENGDMFSKHGATGWARSATDILAFRMDARRRRACIAICRMRSQSIRAGIPSNLCRLAANAM